jgi:hypothetical protein
VRADARTVLCRRWWRRLSQDSIDADRQQARIAMVRLARPEAKRLTLGQAAQYISVNVKERVLDNALVTWARLGARRGRI